jgi:hypothetical protein
VLVVVCPLCGQINFSVKEKDEASLVPLFGMRSLNDLCLHSRLPGVRAFCFCLHFQHWSLNAKPVREEIRGRSERSVMKHILKSMLALATGAALCSTAFGAVPPVSVFEDFRFNPLTNGWKTFGQTNLFAWNATSQNLEVTWDSSKSNSYFYKPLGRTLTRDNRFHLYFDLRLSDIAIGTTSNKPYTFQIAVGLLNFRQATNGAFLRGTGYDSPNVFEFDYFPDSGFGATISPTVISSNNEFATTFILKEVTTGDVFRISMRADDDEGEVSTFVRRNGEFYASDVFQYPMNFTDFAVDTVAIASYSDAGQFPDFAGSVLAHGSVDNIIVDTGSVMLNMEFIGRFENGNWRMDFDTLPEWTYFIDRTEDFADWFLVGSYFSTNYGRATITHTNPPASRAQFYKLSGFRL